MKNSKEISLKQRTTTILNYVKFGLRKGRKTKLKLEEQRREKQRKQALWILV
jgi:hypothetical protein